MVGRWGLRLEGEFRGIWEILVKKGPSGGDLEKKNTQEKSLQDKVEEILQREKTKIENRGGKQNKLSPKIIRLDQEIQHCK